MSQGGESKKIRLPSIKTTVFAHKGCNDGHLAAALCVRGLMKNGHSTASIEIQFVGASLREIKIPARANEVRFDSGDIDIIHHAIFVDLCPTPQHADALENYYEKISVFDHHLSAREFLENKKTDPKWSVHFDMGFCGSKLVFDYFFWDEHTQISVGDAMVDVKAIRHVVELTDAYDTWKSPTESTFKFCIAANLIWAACTARGVKTTIPQLIDYLHLICGRKMDEIENLATPIWDAHIFEWEKTSLHVMDLPRKSGGTLKTMVWIGDSITNQSIGCHMMLEKNPDFKVCMCLFRRIEGDKVVYNASLRSRDVDLISELDWVRGHANACGGILPDTLVNDLYQSRFYTSFEIKQ